MAAVNKLLSRAWSCSELTRGSAAVVDQSPGGAVIKQEMDLLAETADMSAEQLEAMLKACVFSRVCRFDQDVGEAIEAYNQPEEEDAMVGAPVS